MPFNLLGLTENQGERLALKRGGMSLEQRSDLIVVIRRQIALSRLSAV